MLRGLLLVLLLANLAFFAWSQGGLGNTGAAVGGEHEPERLARQVRPEAVQLLIPPTPPIAASSAAANQASGTEAASAPSATASEAASGAASSPAAVDAIASAVTPTSAASTALTTSAASAGAAGSAVVAAAVPAPPAPPGTRCVEAGPFSGAELATAETALAANAKTRRIARRWVPITPEAASAPTPTSPQHRLRIDATPGEVAVLESLPVSVVGRSFVPCTAR